MKWWPIFENAKNDQIASWLIDVIRVVDGMQKSKVRRAEGRNSGIPRIAPDG